MQKVETEIQFLKGVSEECIETFKDFFHNSKDITIISGENYDTVIFEWNIDNNSFSPIRGEFLAANIPMKPYTWLEFKELLHSENNAIMFTLNGQHSSLPLCVKGGYSYKKYIDYPGTISYLCDMNAVDIKNSISKICTDPRCFKLISNNEDDSLRDDGWWEVDILGTTYGSDITEKIIELYNKINI